MENRNAVNLVAGVAGTLLAMFGGVAAAAVPVEATDAFTEMTADFTSLFGTAFTLLALVAVGMLAWKYTKKLSSKL